MAWKYRLHIAVGLSFAALIAFFIAHWLQHGAVENTPVRLFINAAINTFIMFMTFLLLVDALFMELKTVEQLVPYRPVLLVAALTALGHALGNFLLVLEHFG